MLTKAQAKSALAKGAFLMVTYDRGSKAYALSDGRGVSSKTALALIAHGQDKVACSGLILLPQDDGLFDGFTQTWKALITGE